MDSAKLEGILMLRVSHSHFIGRNTEIWREQDSGLPPQKT